VRVVLILGVLLLALLPAHGRLAAAPNERARVIADIPAPPGHVRIPTKKGSFAHWLRSRPLLPPGAPVYYFDGRRKPNQAVHYAVLDMDIGKRDLQQCADAIMRLRAEYLYGKGLHERIVFSVTSGQPLSFREWAEGYRPRFGSRSMRMEKRAARDYSEGNFRSYLVTLYTYAGTASLVRDLTHVRSRRDMRIGDVFIQGGHPGHAVIVVDMARDPSGGPGMFMVAQSYMPAQSVHVLRNPADPDGGPWYRDDFGAQLVTPEWNFCAADLRRFRD